MVKLGVVGSGNGFIRSFVGGDGLIRGHVDVLSSAMNEFEGDVGKLAPPSTLRNASIIVENTHKRLVVLFHSCAEYEVLIGNNWFTWCGSADPTISVACRDARRRYRPAAKFESYTTRGRKI